jgi:hypothetical protein
MSRNRRKRRIDPDPVSVGIAILSAAANATTVAVYLDGLRRDRLREQRRPIALRTKAAIRKLRNELTHLRASTDNVFQMIPRNARANVFRFGSAPLFLDSIEFNIYSDEYQDVLRRMISIQDQVRRIMIDLMDWPDGTIDVPTNALREANTAANRVFDEKLTVAQAYAEIRRVIESTAEHLSEIDDFLSEY